MWAWGEERQEPRFSDQRTAFGKRDAAAAAERLFEYLERVEDGEAPRPFELSEMDLGLATNRYWSPDGILPEAFHVWLRLV